MLTKDLLSPVEVVAITVPLAARILENVRLPLVVVNENTDVPSSDLSITDVEFTNVDLLAVEGKCEIVW